jgi:hypothetical protein
MAESKGFADRVERWLSKIPGIRTYRDREHRRETDKKLREHLAAQLQGARGELKNRTLELSQKNPVDPLLKDLDRLSSRAQQMADTIRYASYGYAGIFDVEKIREEELGRLYDFDLALMEDIDRIQKKVEEMDPNHPPEQWKSSVVDGLRLLDGLEKNFNQRNDFMKKPA